MNTKQLFIRLATSRSLSDTFKEAVETELRSLTLPKNFLLLHPDTIADHLYFLNDGFVMSYSYMDGKKVTEKFWKQNQFITSFESFVEQKPAHEYIQLMTPCELLCIRHDRLQHLLDNLAEAATIYQHALHQHYIYSLKRTQEIKRLHAQVRFENLLRAFPKIEQLVSQDCIASYLGITPQSLSRIKRHKK